MNTNDMTPSQQHEARIRAIEDAVACVERGLGDLQEAVEDLRHAHPRMADVWMVEYQGAKWFADGYRIVRDAWPEDYYPRDAKPNLGQMMPEWEAVTTPVDVVKEIRGEYSMLAKLSSGAWIDADWMRKLTEGRGFTLHHEGGRGSIVYRDKDGKVAAMQLVASASEVPRDE